MLPADSHNCDCYDTLGKRFCLSRQVVYMLSRVNCAIIVASFFIFLALFITFWIVGPETDNSNSILKFLQSDVTKVLIAYLLGGISYLWAIICFFGTFTVGLRCYPCIPL